MWPIRNRAYVVLVKFIPSQGWLLIQIFASLSDMSDSLLIVPTRRRWLSWLINDDEHDYIMIMYLPYNIDFILHVLA
jgi:hypothetical protein